MGVSWYRPEQWECLREISEDKETFAISYEASLVESEKKRQDLEAQGMRPSKVEVDVEALLMCQHFSGHSISLVFSACS